MSAGGRPRSSASSGRAGREHQPDVDLVAFQRPDGVRQLLVFLGAILLSTAIGAGLQRVLGRSCPLGVEILGDWSGFSHPSRPMVDIAVCLIGLIYLLVARGEWRWRAKLLAGGYIGFLCVIRLYLAVDRPTDIIFGVILGVTLTLMGFRLLAPSDAFPITYRRGRRAPRGPDVSPKGAESLILLAQAVPSATKVPCISSYAAGWHFASMSVHNGEGRFTLDSDRAGISAVKVHLRRNCDLEGATEIPSDEPDTRRSERIISVVDNFRAVRSYSFQGGCITYRFDFDRQGRALVNEVSVAIGFIDRSAVGALVRDRSGGDLHL